MSPETLLVLERFVERQTNWRYGYELSRETGLKSGTLYPTLMAKAALLVMVPALASAQNEDHQYRGQGYFFFGLGATSPVVEHVGFGGEGFLYKGLGLGAEVGYARWSGYDNWVGIGSADFSYHFRPRAAHPKVEPFALAGYTLMAHHGTDSAANFGGGVNLWLNKRAALRLEVRDHTHSSLSPARYRDYVSFRVGLTFR